MARPGEVLRSLYQALAPGGSVIVADEKVADRFHAPGDEIERLMYGWSIVHCLPVALADSPSDAIGTVIRRETVRELAEAAGAAGGLMGRPTCAALPQAMRTGQGVASLGCIGNRVYTGLGDEELYFALPGKQVSAVAEKLAVIVNANRELEKYHRARCPA